MLQRINAVSLSLLLRTVFSIIKYEKQRYCNYVINWAQQALLFHIKKSVIVRITKTKTFNYDYKVTRKLQLI